MNNIETTGHRLTQRQLTLAQMLALMAGISVPLLCFVNYAQLVVSTNNGHVTSLSSASGMALLWISAGILFALVFASVLLLRRKWLTAGAYCLMLATPVLFFGPSLNEYFVAPDNSPNPVAEEHTQAMKVVANATRQFVAANNGRWPASWAELRPWIDEPEFKSVSSCVDIDFAGDPNVLCKQKWNEFTGIVPRKPFYNSFDGEVEELISILKSYHDK